MKTVLKLVFKDEENNTKAITIANPKADLDQNLVKESMQKIVDSKAFSKVGVATYVTVVGAHYYTTQSKNVFDAE